MNRNLRLGGGFAALFFGTFITVPLPELVVALGVLAPVCSATIQVGQHNESKVDAGCPRIKTWT
jgi:hypothetical protein